MRCERACAPVRVSLSLSLLGLVCLSWHVYIWQRKTQETSLFNYWWIFCPFFPLPLVLSFCFSWLPGKIILKWLWNILSFSRMTATISIFSPLVSLSSTLLLFGETCQLSEPSLVHLTFKLPLHFFSLYYLSCANTHCFSPFLLSFVKWNRRFLELTVIYI